MPSPQAARIDPKGRPVTGGGERPGVAVGEDPGAVRDQSPAVFADPAVYGDVLLGDPDCLGDEGLLHGGDPLLPLIILSPGGFEAFLAAPFIRSIAQKRFLAVGRVAANCAQIS